MATPSTSRNLSENSDIFKRARDIGNSFLEYIKYWQNTHRQSAETYCNTILLIKNISTEKLTENMLIIHMALHEMKTSICAMESLKNQCKALEALEKRTSAFSTSESNIILKTWPLSKLVYEMESIFQMFSEETKLKEIISRDIKTYAKKDDMAAVYYFTWKYNTNIYGDDLEYFENELDVEKPKFK